MFLEILVIFNCIPAINTFSCGVLLQNTEMHARSCWSGNEIDWLLIILKLFWSVHYCEMLPLTSSLKNRSSKHFSCSKSEIPKNKYMIMHWSFNNLYAMTVICYSEFNKLPPQMKHLLLWATVITKWGY